MLGRLVNWYLVRPLTEADILLGKPKLWIVGSLTPEADGLEEGDAGAGPQVEEVVLGVLEHSLALVPVVVHVEPLAPIKTTKIVAKSDFLFVFSLNLPFFDNDLLLFTVHLYKN